VSQLEKGLLQAGLVLAEMAGEPDMDQLQQGGLPEMGARTRQDLEGWCHKLRRVPGSSDQYQTVRDLRAGEILEVWVLEMGQRAMGSICLGPEEVVREKKWMGVEGW
jgi:hypothetical protein